MPARDDRAGPTKASTGEPVGAWRSPSALTADRLC